MKNIRFLTFVLTIATLLLSACGTAASPATPEAAASAKSIAMPVAFVGIVDSIVGDQWVISGTTVTVDPAIVRDGPFNVGDRVKVEGFTHSDGSLTLSRVEAPMPQANATDDNSNDANVNDDNSNTANSNDDHGGSLNSNDDNSNTANTNDDHGGSSVNSNDGNSNTVSSNGNSNVNDDNGSTANTNDDHGGSSNGNDDNSGSGGGNDNGGSDDNGNGG